MSVVIGLTGNIASGKSTVGKVFEKYKIPVLDSDELVYDIYANDEEVKAALVREFGTCVRKEIANKVFGKDNEDKRRSLESIIHPKVDIKFRTWLKENKDANFLVNLVPLLFEAHLETRYNYVITVASSKELQIQRLKLRNPELSEEEIIKRIESQMNQEEKLRKSDFVIDNSQNIDDLDIQVEEILEQIIKKEGLDISLLSQKN